MVLAFSKKLFLFIIIFSPLAFGTVEPWSYAIMEIIVCASLLLYCFYLYKSEAKLYRVPGVTPLVLLLFYILFQTIPLPPQIIKLISPASYALQDASPIMTISIHPRATLLEFFRYSTYVLFYILAVHILIDKIMLRKTVLIIIIFGSILAFSSILQAYLTHDMALWIRYCPDRSTIMGPFINRNHYAGLMEMIFPLSLALFLFHKPRTDGVNFFKSIIEIFKQEKANIHILIGTGALLIIISVFVCLSRGGIISICIGLLFFVLLSFKKKQSHNNSFLIIILIIITGLSISWFGWNNINDRFARIDSSGGDLALGRFQYWEDSKKIIDNFPVTGSGFGTFSDIYPSFQSIEETADLQHAHNDYIELLTEGGLIGFFLTFCVLFTIFYKTYKSFILRKDAYSILIYIGSITGMFSILIHSLSDFNFHVGSNGLWFALLAALAVSASNTRLRVKNLATNLLPVKSKSIKYISFTIVSILFLIITLSNISILLAGFYYSNIKHMDINFKTPVMELEKIKKIACHALFFDPLNSEYVHTAANVFWLLHDNEQAEKYYLKSIRLDPANGNHVKRFGLFLTQTNKIANAEKFLKKSINIDITSADNVFQYGGLLLSTGQKKQGLKYLKKAIKLNKKMMGPVLTTMNAAKLSLQEMEKAIPDSPDTKITYADFLYQIGETAMAAAKYQDIVNSFTKQNISDKYVRKISRFFISQGNLFEADKVLKKGENLLPFNASIKVMLGDLYKKQGILFKAKEKYEDALFLAPEKRNIMLRLKNLNQ